MNILELSFILYVLKLSAGSSLLQLEASEKLILILLFSLSFKCLEHASKNLIIMVLVLL